MFNHYNAWQTFRTGLFSSTFCPNVRNLVLYEEKGTNRF
jgi:hypothetical protein